MHVDSVAYYRGRGWAVELDRFGRMKATRQDGAYLYVRENGTVSDLFIPERDTVKPKPVCDICNQSIEAGERFHDDGSEIAHTACVGNWFRSNWGRESLS